MGIAVDLFHIVVLSVVQGLTEFLPVSSSGHLILVPKLLGWPDQGHLMDVAVHLGTLAAVLLYSRKDVGRMIVGLWMLVRGKRDPGARLAFLILVATLPVIPAGFLMEKFEDSFRNLALVGWTTLGYGALLWIVDRATLTVKRMEHVSYLEAFLIGIAQCLALVPGTSRSGVTMTAARLFGYERAEAARFSFLMSIPTISAAGLLAVLHIVKSGDAEMGADALLAAGFSFLTGLVAIWILMAWLKRATFTPFAVYRLALGGALLFLAYGLGW